MPDTSDTPTSPGGIDRLLAVMARLRRRPDGCEWDLEQDFRSLIPYAIEEAYEVVDAIESGDMAALKEELGDLLLQVVFHGQIAAEEGLFTFDEIAHAIADKMIRRHPHIFENAAADDERRVDRWERIKAAERAAKQGGAAESRLDGVAVGLPALLRASKIQGRAARAGFDWPDAEGVLAKLREETEELAVEMTAKAEVERLEDELGDLFFSAVNLSRRLELDPESALRRATAKFERRFRLMERLSAAPLEQLDAPSLDALWNEAKRMDASSHSS